MKMWDKVDKGLWARAKAAAALDRKPLYQWLEEAVKEKLERSE